MLPRGAVKVLEQQCHVGLLRRQFDCVCMRRVGAGSIAALALSLRASHSRATKKERRCKALAHRQTVDTLVRLAAIEINGSAPAPRFGRQSRRAVRLIEDDEGYLR
jgi:hypothetical protein